MTDQEPADVSVAEILRRIAGYYDETTGAYLDAMGPTLQAGLPGDDEARDSFESGNVRWARRAGISPGDRVLDAGCGVCGPAIDIALAIDDVQIDGLTISPVQAEIASARIAEAGLTDRVRVHVRDYHEPGFDDDTFDVVMFLEASGYAYDPRRLFAGAHRVLRRGGTLYLKDLFRRFERDLTSVQRVELERFDEIYRHRTPRASERRALIEDAGFADVRWEDLSPMLSIKT
ncbi:MAG: methyltransferase domain-containing protein, partial [Myxococcota bacterium]|nr:methyltransferase domain-containing protein [Myxococcota bacterium]